ncbi:MAG: hypothetical protein ACTSU6_06565, partial [Candidatus Njordarchaeales archaeon]
QEDEELTELLERIIILLNDIKDDLEKGSKNTLDYSIISIFIGFIPIFLFVFSFIQSNPDIQISPFIYWTLLCFFAFILSTCFIWAVKKIGEMETPLTIGLTFALPIFIVSMPLILSILIIFQIIQTAKIWWNMALIVIIGYAIFFSAICLIHFVFAWILKRVRERS